MVSYLLVAIERDHEVPRVRNYSLYYLSLIIYESQKWKNDVLCSKTYVRLTDRKSKLAKMVSCDL